MFGVSGPKRANPYADGEPDAQVARGPQERYDELVGKLTDRDLLDDPDVQWYLRLLTSGNICSGFKDREGNMQFVFRQLLQHKQFEVFAEVFLLYGSFKAEYAQVTGEPFENSLDILLPADWVCTDSAAMDLAFSKIRVSRLVVTADAGDGVGRVVSADTCRCIALMLKNGTTELAITGALALPGCVVDAFAHSQLRSISLRVGQSNDMRIKAHELPSHNCLLAGLTTCPTLTDLDFNHTLGQSTAVLNNMREGGCPQLTSLSLGLNDVAGVNGTMVDGSSARNLMATIGQFAQLSKLQMVNYSTGLVMRDSDFLDPLHGHPRLTRLQILNQAAIDDTNCCYNLQFLPNVVSFAKSCAALRGFAWKQGVRSGSVLQAVAAFIRAGGILRSTTRSTFIADALQDPAFALRDVMIDGMVLSSDDVENFMAGIAFNRSLKNLDFSGCPQDAAAAAVLLQSLDSNLNMESAMLPSPDGFFFVAGDDRVHTFQSNYEQFELKTARASKVENQRDIDTAAHLAFDRKEDRINGLLFIPGKLSKNRVTAALRQLVPSMQVVLKALAQPHLPVGVVADDDLFAYMAERGLRYLHAQQALPAAVRITEVNKEASLRYHELMQSNGSSEPDPRLRKLVARTHTAKLDSEIAARKKRDAERLSLCPNYVYLVKLPQEQQERHHEAMEAVEYGLEATLLQLLDTGVSVNTVDRSGNNLLMMQASKSGNNGIWTLLLEKGAVDFDGNAYRKAEKYAKRDAELAKDIPGYGYASLLSEAAFALHSMALQAIQDGDGAALAKAIDDGAPFNVMDGRRANSVLRCAGVLGRGELLAYLMQRGAVDFGYQGQMALDSDFEISDDDDPSDDPAQTPITAPIVTAEEGATPPITTAANAVTATVIAPSNYRKVTLAELTGAQQDLHQEAADAIRHLDELALQRAIDKGAELNVVNGNDTNMLLLTAVQADAPASEARLLRTVRLLMAKGATDFAGGALTAAYAEPHSEAVRAALAE